MCPLEGLHYSGRHEPSFTPGEISLRGDFHHYQATEKSWAHNGPVLSVPYLINLFSDNSVNDSVLEHCHALLYTVFFWIMASSFTMIYWLIYLFIIYFRILEKREQVSSCKFTAHKENRRKWLFSDGPGWQESAFGKSSTSFPVEPVHKLITKGNQVEGSVYVCYEGSWEQSQFCHLWRENSTYFFKFYLFTPPVGANYPLFPHQDVVPLIGPCSVLWVQQHVLNSSPVLEEQSNPWQTTAIGNIPSVPSTGERAQPDHRDLLEETSQDRRGKSRVWLRGKLVF